MDFLNKMLKDKRGIEWSNIVLSIVILVLLVLLIIIIYAPETITGKLIQQTPTSGKANSQTSSQTQNSLYNTNNQNTNQNTNSQQIIRYCEYIKVPSDYNSNGNTVTYYYDNGNTYIDNSYSNNQNEPTQSQISYSKALKYSSYKKFVEDDALVGDYVDRYIVYVTNEDSRSGYFTVKMYLHDYDGRLITKTFRKYIDSGEDYKFSFDDVHQRYKHSFSYKVFPEERTYYESSYDDSNYYDDYSDNTPTVSYVWKKVCYN